MLYIIFKDKNKKEQTVCWHVGEPVNQVFLTNNEILRVQADCDELNYVIDHFPNLPYSNNTRTVAWYGDLAKLIAMNLK